MSRHIVYTAYGTFEWDVHKREQNLFKHQIDFFKIIPMFSRPCLDRLDDRKDYGEIRWVSMGELEGLVLRVIYTMRGDAIRFISARRANRNERKTYFLWRTRSIS